MADEDDVVLFGGIAMPFNEEENPLDPAVWVEQTIGSGGFTERTITASVWVESGD